MGSVMKILKCRNIYYEKENSQTYPSTSNLCPKSHACLYKYQIGYQCPSNFLIGSKWPNLMWYAMPKASTTDWSAEAGGTPAARVRVPEDVNF